MAGFHTVGPNHALIVSGGSRRPKVKVGGRMFVLPFLQKAQLLSLEVMTLQVNTARVYTKQGVSVSVDGVAQVKVGRGEDAIRTAAEQFLDKTVRQIAEVALQTLEGQQRAILGTMTVEDIYRDRVAFAEQVRDVAATDMTNMGLEIVSFAIRDIQDEQGYLEALGVRRTSEVKRDAAIGEAEAARDSGIKSAQADQQRQAAKFSADTAIAESERDYESRKAEYAQQVNARRAEAELAYPLQEAKTRQNGFAERSCRSRSSKGRSRSRFSSRRSCVVSGSWMRRSGVRQRPSATSSSWWRRGTGAARESKPKPNDTNSRRWPRASAPVSLRRPRQRPKRPYYGEKPTRRPSRRAARLRGRPSGPRDSRRPRRWTRRPMRGSSTDRLP